MSSPPSEASIEADKLKDLLSPNDANVGTDVSENNARPSKKPASKAKTFYLVDFENTGLQILDGVEKIDPQTECVCLFSTKNAPNIPTAVYAKIIEIQKCNIDAFAIHEVPAKSQSVDMHLVSYLGYLIGIHGTTCKYVILSNDTDYDNIVKYWKECEKVDVKRQGKPTPAKQPTAPAVKQPTPPPAKQPASPVVAKTATTASKSTVSKQVESQQKTVSPNKLPPNTVLNNLILKEVGKLGYSDAGKVASIVCKEYKTGNFVKLHSELQKAFPGKNIKNLYAAVKSAVAEFLESSTKGNKPTSAKQTEPTPDVSVATTPPNKTTTPPPIPKNVIPTKQSAPSSIESEVIQNTISAWNITIQEAIRGIGYSKEIARQVASIVCKARKRGRRYFLGNALGELMTTFPGDKKITQTVELLIKDALTTSPPYKVPRTAVKTFSLKKAVISILSVYDNVPEAAKVAPDVVAEIAAEHYDKYDAKQAIQEAFTREYGKTDGLIIYNFIKHLF